MRECVRGGGGADRAHGEGAALDFQSVANRDPSRRGRGVARGAARGGRLHGREACGVSDQYGVRDAACPLSTGGGGQRRLHRGAWLRRPRARAPAPGASRRSGSRVASRHARAWRAGARARGTWEGQARGLRRQREGFAMETATGGAAGGAEDVSG